MLTFSNTAHFTKYNTYITTFKSTPLIKNICYIYSKIHSIKQTFWHLNIQIPLIIKSNNLNLPIITIYLNLDRKY
jgi:hypothetical protein